MDGAAAPEQLSETVASNHRRIVDAIATRDPDAAEAACRVLITQARDEVSRSLDR